MTDEKFDVLEWKELKNKDINKLKDTAWLKKNLVVQEGWKLYYGEKVPPVRLTDVEIHYVAEEVIKSVNEDDIIVFRDYMAHIINEEESTDREGGVCVICNNFNKAGDKITSVMREVVPKDKYVLDDGLIVAETALLYLKEDKEEKKEDEDKKSINVD